MSLAFIGEGFLFGSQNRLFWNMLCCLHVRSLLVAYLCTEEIHQKNISLRCVDHGVGVDDGSR
jgi:hypothetical protein